MQHNLNKKKDKDSILNNKLIYKNAAIQKNKKVGNTQKELISKNKINYLLIAKVSNITENKLTPNNKLVNSINSINDI